MHLKKSDLCHYHCGVKLKCLSKFDSIKAIVVILGVNGPLHSVGEFVLTSLCRYTKL